MVTLVALSSTVTARMTHQGVFTDNALAAMNAIVNVYPSALNKLCLWHTYQNIREHWGGLGEGVLPEVIQRFRTAAYGGKQSFLRGAARSPQMVDLWIGVDEI